jgi:murein biosynthesis integral membrane protein MurJ
MCLGLAGLTYVVLNAHGYFALPECAKVAYKAAIVLGVMTMVPQMGIVMAGAAMCGASILQLALHAYGFREVMRSGTLSSSDGSIALVGNQPTLAAAEGDSNIACAERNLTPHPLSALLKLMVPLAIGTIAAQVGGYVDNNRGSTLPSGSLAALAYARKLVDVPILLVPSVLGVVAMPRFAEFAADHRWDSLTALLTRLIETCVILFVPASLLLVFTPEPIVRLVFERGQFDSGAVALTSRAVAFFSIGLIAYALESLVLRVFYSTLDTATPVVTGLVCLCIHIALTIVLTPLVGIVAIPLALSAQKTVKVAVLLTLLAHRHPGPWLFRLAKTSAGTAICGLSFWLVFHLTSTAIALGTRSACHLGGWAAGIVVGAIAYCVALSSLGLVDFKQPICHICRWIEAKRAPRRR